MAEVYRPTYSAIDPTTGKRVKRKSKTWHVRYYTPSGERLRAKGFRDRKATEALGTELERRAMRLASGLSDAFDENAKRPLAEHLDEFRDYLTAKGNTVDGVGLTFARIQAALDGCRFVKIGDVQPSAIVGFIARVRESKSVATANHYLTAVKGFTRWLWKDRRTASDPLAGLSKLASSADDVRRARRELSLDELRLLIDTAAKSDRTFRGLSGRDRASLYAAAVGTGFRASELASLTPESLDLDADPPAVALAAGDSKNRKAAMQPIPPELAAVLSGFLDGRGAGGLVWPGTWPKKAAAMIGRDLADARTDWLQSVQDARIRDERERSDFLAYCDAEERYADFHALRHTYISLIVRSGATVKTAQTLARHSTPMLTLGRYSHAGYLT